MGTRQAVADPKEILHLEARERMGHVSAGFHLGDVGSHDIGDLPISQVTDEVQDDDYPRPATVVGLCGALSAPSVAHVLRYQIHLGCWR